MLCDRMLEKCFAVALEFKTIECVVSCFVDEVNAVYCRGSYL